MDDEIFDEMDLPFSSNNEDLETLSKNLFRLLFDVTKFEIRSEDLRDKGIDLQIELKKASRYTNFRLAVQLKATDATKVNQDQSISIQVSTRNINYLLNSPMPAYYVLYSKSTNTYYFESINEYVRMLSLNNAEWQKQKSHVLRFSKVLTSGVVNEIYDATLKKGKFHRLVNEKLIQQSAAINSSSKILFDSNLKISDDSEITRLIEIGGFQLINEGRWQDLIFLHKQGSGTIARSARYNLILGIANYYNGNLVEALSHLKSADRLKSELANDHAIHLEYFIVSVKHSLGIVEDVEYSKRMEELADAENVGLYVKIDKARTEYYHDLLTQSDEKFDKLVGVMKEIKNHPGSDNGLKFYADSELIYIEGSKNNWDYVKGIAMINAHEITAGRDPEVRANLSLKLVAARNIWLENVEGLKAETSANKNYFYYFNTVINEIKVLYEMLVFTEKVVFEDDAFKFRPQENVGKNFVVSGLLEKLSKSLAFYRHIGHIENVVVALCLQYELEHFVGDYSTAANTLAEAEHLATNYELTDKIRRLQHLKERGSTHETFTSFIDGVFVEADQTKIEVLAMINEMENMDAEERGQEILKVKYLNIHLFPIGFFRFPEAQKKKVYEILNVHDITLQQHFDELFEFAIPIANVYYQETTQEGLRDGKLADRGIDNWKNMYRVRTEFYKNKFYRNESINL